MPEYVPLDLPENPKLAGNITHFARALRRAGLPIGPGRVIDAVRAVQAAGFTDKNDFFWTLQACFVAKPEQKRVFAQVFRLYWRDPRYLERRCVNSISAIRKFMFGQMASANKTSFRPNSDCISYHAGARSWSPTAPRNGWKVYNRR